MTKPWRSSTTSRRNRSHQKPGAGLDYPYFGVAQREPGFWDEHSTDYLQRLEKNPSALEKRVKELDPTWAKLRDGKSGSSKEAQLENWRAHDIYATDAYRMLANYNTPCLGCHQVGSIPAKNPKHEQGPPLDLGWERLRPGWAFRWIANPDRLLSYPTPMPQNFPNNQVDAKGLSTNYPEFIGTPTEQVAAVRNLLLDFRMSRHAGKPETISPRGNKEVKRKRGMKAGRDHAMGMRSPPPPPPCQGGVLLRCLGCCGRGRCYCDATAPPGSKWGDIKGRVVLDAPVAPEPKVLDIVKDQQHCLGKGPITSDALIVDKKTLGVKDVFVWLAPIEEKDKLAIHPALKNPAKKEVEVSQPCCMFVPHSLCMRVGQVLVAKNPSPIAHNFHYQGFKNPGDNKIMAAGGELKISGLVAEERSRSR